MSATTSAVNPAALTVDVQIAIDEDSAEPEEPPSPELLIQWARNAYAAVNQTPGEVTLRICDQDEISALNRDYRGKDKPTNVLSFPFDDESIPSADMLQEMGALLIGDVVICHSVIVAEAREQGKSMLDHYAHMVTHGILHLCGYDHQNDAEAAEMEALEIRILANSNIADPYH